MRISDWSSDVCSSDLSRHDPLDQFRRFAELQPFMLIGAKQAGVGPPHQLFRIAQNVGEGVDAVVFRFSGRGLVEHREDRVRRLVRRPGSGTTDERKNIHADAHKLRKAARTETRRLGKEGRQGYYRRWTD